MTTRGGIGSTGYGMRGVGESSPGAPEFKNIGPSHYSMSNTITTGDYMSQNLESKKNLETNIESQEVDKNEKNIDELPNIEEEKQIK